MKAARFTIITPQMLAKKPPSASKNIGRHCCALHKGYGPESAPPSFGWQRHKKHNFAIAQAFHHSAKHFLARPLPKGNKLCKQTYDALVFHLVGHGQIRVKNVQTGFDKSLFAALQTRFLVAPLQQSDATNWGKKRSPHAQNTLGRGQDKAIFLRTNYAPMQGAYTCLTHKKQRR